MQPLTLTFDEAMLFAFGLCAHRTDMVGLPCRWTVVDGESDELTRESRFCGTHVAAQD